ncbi:hypothetical protein [Janthinobacterium sp. CG_S6]|uniref:hypothetical protein n=1 Tax=Janthinobacterium sp. CG_S6 TaxID=3071707 RepID=UPI002DFF15D2|nr:hypothetical protein [Janthinobacterium sp. CG_S6]
MAETNTTQGAKLVAKTKLMPHESHGRVRMLCSKMPAAFAQLAVNDTIFIGRLPIGSRILNHGTVSAGAGTATSVLDIGLRSTLSGTVIDADGIAVGIDIAAAGNSKAANSGALIAAGAEYVTLEEVDVYATVRVAAGIANQVMKFEIPYVVD